MSLLGMFAVALTALSGQAPSHHAEAHLPRSSSKHRMAATPPPTLVITDISHNIVVTTTTGPFIVGQLMKLKASASDNSAVTNVDWAFNVNSGSQIGNYVVPTYSPTKAQAQSPVSPVPAASSGSTISAYISGLADTQAATNLRVSATVGGEAQYYYVRVVTVAPTVVVTAVADVVQVGKIQGKGDIYLHIGGELPSPAPGRTLSPSATAVPGFSYSYQVSAPSGGAGILFNAQIIQDCQHYNRVVNGSLIGQTASTSKPMSTAPPTLWLDGGYPYGVGIASVYSYSISAGQVMGLHQSDSPAEDLTTIDDYGGTYFNESTSGQMALLYKPNLSPDGSANTIAVVIDERGWSYGGYTNYDGMNWSLANQTVGQLSSDTQSPIAELS